MHPGPTHIGTNTGIPGAVVPVAPPVVSAAAAAAAHQRQPRDYAARRRWRAAARTMRRSTSAAPRPRRDRSARSAPPSARRWRPGEALRGRRTLACASACALRRRASRRTRRDAQRGGRARCAAIAAQGTAEGAAKRSARPAPPVARGWRRRPRRRLNAQGACSESSGTGVVSISARAQGCTARPTRSRLQVASPAAGRHNAIGMSHMLRRRRRRAWPPSRRGAGLTAEERGSGRGAGNLQ